VKLKNLLIKRDASKEIKDLIKKIEMEIERFTEFS